MLQLPSDNVEKAGYRKNQEKTNEWLRGWNQQRWVRVHLTARGHSKQRVQNLDLTSTGKLVRWPSWEGLLERTTKTWSATWRLVCLRSAMIWGFMSATMKAAVHLGQEYQVNVCTTKNTQKLITDQDQEIYGISTVDWNTIPWVRSTLLNDRTVKLSTAKVYVFSHSVLCLTKIAEYPRSVVYRILWNIVNWTAIMENHSWFEWKHLPRTHHTGVTSGNQKNDRENRIQPEQFENRIIFMSMYKKKKNQEIYMSHSSDFAAHSRRFPEGHSSDRELKKNETEPTSINRAVCGTR